MITWLSIGISGLVIFQFFVLLVRIIFYWKDHKYNHSTVLPAVSILVAARNEERDLPDLLKSLEQLDYPEDKVQILFADDQSVDLTAEILKNWCSMSTNRTLLSVDSSHIALYNKNGKANALAILEGYATGEYYFFTDADCEVNPNWIREGVRAFGENIGLVIGITQVKSASLMEKFQEIDWWMTLGFVKVATDLNIQTTGLGNNMVISKEAYQACGGFRNLPFCLTEDLEISRAIQRRGFKIVHQVSAAMLAHTKPETGFRNLLHQRKRWMNGVMTLPFYWKLLLALQVLYFVAIIAITLVNPLVGVGIALVKVLLQSVFLRLIAMKAKAKVGWISLLLFDFYNLNTTVLTILYYFWPSKTKWKSRIYP